MKSLKAFQSNPLKTYKNLPGIENKIAGTKFEAPVDAFSSQAFGILFQTDQIMGTHKNGN